MPRDSSLKKVMVIGSGPIVIGQAAEFDYAGTQACKALKEEGLEVVLVNSNPATIMTDPDLADRVYLEPLTLPYLTEIIRKERPDGLLPTLGGQTGLNAAVNLAKAGVLEQYNVRLLGTPLEAIQKAEDRNLFKKTMQSIGEPIPESVIAETYQEAEAFAKEVGLPVIIRPAYTLGGTGGGIAGTWEEFREIVSRGLKVSMIHQILLEQSVAGWKEIEFEVIRDGSDTCITICSMENIDPIGIHTGDSIVVAPTQTLNEPEFQMMRGAALKIIRALGIEGGCNIQFALEPTSRQYVVIEVNPRVSRSSALASKATGYPIAKVAAKIAVGFRLDEIENAVTKKTKACFEPSIDYVVVKVPRWPFDKFHQASRGLGTQMKATGEVMAIDRSLEAALQKAVRSLEIGLDGLFLPDLSDLTDGELRAKLLLADDERLFVLAESFRRGVSLQELQDLTKIDRFFLRKMEQIVAMERELDPLTPQKLAQAKALGFADTRIAKLTGKNTEEIWAMRQQEGILPVYKMVDTCAGEFDAATPYYYSTYDQEDEVQVGEGRKIVVLGSGPIRIGQGVEFDYCSVHSAWALREAGVESVIVNNNPETVSTDFDTSDRLYFEPLTCEDLLHILDKEKPEGVIVQFGGQTAINLAGPLSKLGIPILGTSVEGIDLAEDRERFSHLLLSLGIPQTEGVTALSLEEAMGAGMKLGFPLVVRPSYVLGGRGMQIVESEEDLYEYLRFAVKITPDHPVLLDRYLRGREVEVDAICDGEEILIPGIMEHIERAGVHSGDSLASFPTMTLSLMEEETIVGYTREIARKMKIIGLMNVQYVIEKGRVVVLEVNPRASRTVPILSKVTGVPMVKVATRAMLGESLRQQGYTPGLMRQPPFWAIKAPVFSFEKLGLVETSLGPEMKSTGEVLGLDPNPQQAVAKAFLAAGLPLPKGGKILASIADRDKEEAMEILAGFAKLGFELLATPQTARGLAALGIKAQEVSLTGPLTPVEVLRGGEVDLVINTPTQGRRPSRAGFRLRRAAVEFHIPALTSLDTARAYLGAIQSLGEEVHVASLGQYLATLAPKGELGV